jgi:hypothetical protein
MPPLLTVTKRATARTAACPTNWKNAGTSALAMADSEALPAVAAALHLHAAAAYGHEALRS